MIELENVRYNYKSGNEIISNFFLEVKAGEFLAIIGKNGSGKSTLARLIAGLDKPQKGSIRIHGIDTKNKKDFISLRKTISMVFQNPENQIVFNKVYDDMIFALKNLYGEKGDFFDLIRDSLKKVGMEEYIYANPNELSMGQKQRIAIASVLATGAKTIVFDEPTTMLDNEGKIKIYEILMDLKSQGYTIIYITNVIDEILMSDRIILLEKGKINKDFYCKDIFDNLDGIQETGFEIPKIIKLIIELRKVGFNIEIEKFEFDEVLKRIAEEKQNEKFL